jgi:RHS repeat-associated protein
MTARTAAQGSQTLVYDARRLPVWVDGGGTTVARFAYDGDGVRRKRLDAAGTVHYPFGHYERKVGNGAGAAEVTTKHLRALGRTLAVRKNGTLYWLGTDHLGSTVRTAAADWSAVDQMRYTPYGAARDTGANVQTDERFTGQTDDAAVGLYWYKARAYDPVLARLVCPDTVVPSLARPQTLNAYAYALNNPATLTDPTGHVPFGPGRAAAGLGAIRDAFGAAVPRLIKDLAPAPVAPLVIADPVLGGIGLGALADPVVDPVGARAVADPVQGATGLDVLAAEAKQPPSVGTAPELVQLARSVHEATPEGKGRDSTTIAVGRTQRQDGTEVLIVASSAKDRELRREQARQLRELAPDAEVAEVFPEHAELTVLNGADVQELPPGEMAASRDICDECAEWIYATGWTPVSPLKHPENFTS